MPLSPESDKVHIVEGRVMAGWKNAGPLNSLAAPMNLDDGTLPLTPGVPPGILHISFSWPFQEEIRRTGYVKDALARAASKYSVPAIIQHTTKDFLQIIEGVVQGLLTAFAGLIVTVALGAIIGGAIGSLAGGVGAAPGAVAGADIGLTVGEGILAWLGLGFLAIFLASLGGQVKLMGQEIQDGVRTAWNSRGELSAIDIAAQRLADAVGIACSLLLMAIIAYLTKASREGEALGAMEKLKSSLLFKRCKFFEPWLVENFPKLRARYFKLQWEVLAEDSSRIPGTSIPKSITIKVGERVFEIDRNAEKLDAAGNPIGPATKHLGEAAQNASEWSKLAETDFPISSLAGALDQAEAQLMFQTPQARAKPVKLGNWELLIDTRGKVWRVFHAVYTPNPRW